MAEENTTTTHPGEKPVKVGSRTITRQTLIKDAVRQMLEIEDLFNTADYWNRNVRKADEDPINPDPDGELAKAWLNFSEEMVGLLMRVRPAFTKHFEQYRPKNIVEFKNHNA